MDFLKEILGDELFKQFKEKVDAFNGNEANKDKQVKIGNLGTGEYVGKGKFDALQELMNGKDTELKSANDLIAQLKKATKGNEDIQKKVADYEAENAKLQAELAETKMKSAIKVALLSEKAVDVDYLTFKLNEKLKEKGENLELDENDNIKGWDDKLSGLKTQFPTMFESASASGDKKIIENKLKEGDNNNGLTKGDLLKKPYAERMKIFNENPEAYREAMNS
ncbi:phage scaffolding protein [Bacillus infantis]|uniref:phage scaffolding protein n=1 Tax=Bacillus infantis TaxID=324767 RepID=UPI003CF1770C